MAENTPAKHLDPFKWEPGQSGNPKGRPKGARHRLGEAFIEALHDDFVAHGVSTIERVRTEDPVQYVKVVASLLPKDINLNLNDDRDYSDDELADKIRDLITGLAPLLAGIGAPEKDLGVETCAEQPAQVH